MLKRTVLLVAVFLLLSTLAQSVAPTALAQPLSFAVYLPLVERWANCDKRWQLAEYPDPAYFENFLTDIAMIGPDDMWAVGYGDVFFQGSLILHWTGKEWQQSITPHVGQSYLQNKLSSITAISAHDIWAVGSNGINLIALHWDGRQWLNYPINITRPMRMSARLHSVAGQGSTDVWAVGEYWNGTKHTALTVHWDGSQWTQGDNVNPNYHYSVLYGLTVIGPNDIWAVGEVIENETSHWRALVLHWDGLRWNELPTLFQEGYQDSLSAVAAVSTNDVWAVGVRHNQSQWPAAETLILHWDGLAWTRVASPNPASYLNILNGIAVHSKNDIWAMGHMSRYGALALHWDGMAWSYIPIPPLTKSDFRHDKLSSATVLPNGEVLAVGSYDDFDTPGPATRALILRYHGKPCFQ